MKDEGASNQILDNLSAALAEGRFPDAVSEQAEKLCKKLAAPTRITLFGMPLMGKTGVLNLLAGSIVVPEGVDLGTIQVEHGPTDKTIVTLQDGQTLEMPGLPDPEKLGQLVPALTRIQSPLPALAKISLMELGQSTQTNGQARAISWAAKQTDIGIWCTESFLDLELSQWLTTPERLRDHSLLLLTRADLLGKAREQALSVLRDKAGNDFALTLGVSVLEVQAAVATGSVDKDKMRASGGMKLISTLLRMIENGRQHMLDEAEVLMRTHLDIKRAKPQLPEQPAQAAPGIQDLPDPDARSEQVVTAFRSAADRLAEVGSSLSGVTDPEPRTVLDASAEALSWLGTHFEEADLPDIPVVLRARAMTQDAEDLVQLMQIEKADEDCTDAILALSQLKRGFQAAIAA